VVNGLRLSIQCRPPVLSVVLRNVSAQPLSLTIPGWLFFFQVEIDAPMSGYGQALLKPERRTEQIALTLKPGEPTETDIPVSLLFVNPSGHYARVVCVLPDGSRLESNRTLIR
jgi:hypothetical protein